MYKCIWCAIPCSIVSPNKFTAVFFSWSPTSCGTMLLIKRAPTVRSSSEAVEAETDAIALATFPTRLVASAGSLIAFAKTGLVRRRVRSWRRSVGPKLEERRLPCYRKEHKTSKMDVPIDYIQNFILFSPDCAATLTHASTQKVARKNTRPYE
jgi:hypothetical protein